MTTLEEFEENLNKIKQEEIREQISNMFKDECMEFLQMKLESISEHDLKEQIMGTLKEAYNKSAIIPYYEITRTKLPRKLKKKYKKERRICFGFEYIEYKQPRVIEITIPIEENAMFYNPEYKGTK